MNNSRFKWILYLIVVVIGITIAIQVYWNYRNYKSSKQQLVNDVQLALDTAVANYYEILAKKSTIGFSFEEGFNSKFFEENGEFDRLVEKIDENGLQFTDLDTLSLQSENGIRVFRGVKADSLLRETHNPTKNSPIRQLQIEDHSHVSSDSFPRKDFELLTSKIIISISTDTLNLKTIDSLVGSELLRKNLGIDYRLVYESADSVITKTGELESSRTLKAISNSTFLPVHSKLEMDFSNIVFTILKRIIAGILISSLLVLAVISSLFYLLKVIKSQKQLAEVKNDLISNITHEFKTPIATISVALESVQNFHDLNDKEKTKSYLKMSADQLNKLNTMVEKLLETASLDSELIVLTKEKIDIITLLKEVVQRHEMSANNKTITLDLPQNEMIAEVDVFHFENAINNIIDNAIKYGGDSITIKTLDSVKGSFDISISDNGKSLTTKDKTRIFDKFYRVPKGNTHDVKGFGIGLYYTRKIIEKHGGTVTINLDKTGTTFIISIP